MYYLKITKLKIKKLLKLFFFSLFLLQLFGLALVFVLPTASNADTKIEFTPQITVDEFKKDTSYAVPASTEMIAKYIRAIYKYTIGIVGILATVVMMVGGIIWLTAGGNATRVGEAKSWITASLTGLVLALCSYLILATVNPALVNFKITNVESVTAVGCCTYKDSDGKSTSESLNQTDCKKKSSYSWKSGSCSTSTSAKTCCLHKKKVTYSSLCMANITFYEGCNRNDLKTASDCENYYKSETADSPKTEFEENKDCSSYSSYCGIEGSFFTCN